MSTAKKKSRTTSNVYGTAVQSTAKRGQLLNLSKDIEKSPRTEKGKQTTEKDVAGEVVELGRITAAVLLLV